MGKVSDNLIEMLARHVADRGIVVWYDPHKAYTGLVQRLALPGTTFLRYEEGFFRLRQQLEPFLECINHEGGILPEADQPPAIILYIPLAREENGYAMIEVETAGVVMEPGAARTECNTRLGLLAERVFGEIAPAKAAHLARQADDGLLTLDELDRMAEDAGAKATGALQVIFGHASAEEIILQFLALDTRDQAIAEKDALNELVVFLSDEIGFGAPVCRSASELRMGLRRYVLATDLLLYIPQEDMPEALRRLPLPEKNVQQDLIRHVCAVWRNRIDLKEYYVEAAEAVDKTYGFHAVALLLSHLREAETFPSIERRWLNHAAEKLNEGYVAEALQTANARGLLFWAKERPAFQMEWQVIEMAANVCQESKRIDEDLRKRKWTLDEMVDAYASHAVPWMRLDRYARHLDSRYARLESMDSGAEGLEKAVIMARQRYANTLNVLTSAYAVAAHSAEFTSRRLGCQSDVFKAALRPLLDKEIKMAYFLVDALRYEMACELLEGLGVDYESKIETILGQLPGITFVGMAALLPGADEGLSLEKKGAGLCVLISGQALPTRQARMTWITERAGVPTAVYRMGEVVKLTPKRKKEIEATRLIVVTSQEIDRLGEDAAEEEETRVYMDEVLEKVRRAIRSLSRAGVRQFVISADHGFHLVDSVDPGLSMDAPGGDTAELHPRVWIGQGGGAADGYLRCKASDLELGGSLEYAFPRGLGTFKVKGGVGSYFHGGISLQEHVLPLIFVKAPKAGIGARSDIRVKLSISKTKITNRIFTVTVDAESEGLFPGAEMRVRVEVFAGKDPVGQAVVAGYGYEESTREIAVTPGKPNVVTLMIGAGEAPNVVTVQVWDCESQLVLDSIKDIPVELGI